MYVFIYNIRIHTDICVSVLCDYAYIYIYLYIHIYYVYIIYIYIYLLSRFSSFRALSSNTLSFFSVQIFIYKIFIESKAKGGEK